MYGIFEWAGGRISRQVLNFGQWHQSYSNDIKLIEMRAEHEPKKKKLTTKQTEFRSIK